MKKALVALAFALTASSNLLASDIDSASANVSMDVALYASVTGLSDLNLVPAAGQTSGAANTTYEASDDFNVESNGQIRITADSHIHGGLQAQLRLDNGAYSHLPVSANTAADSTHNATHSVDVYTHVENISDTKAGDYTGWVSVTVSAL